MIKLVGKGETLSCFLLTFQLFKRFSKKKKSAFVIEIGVMYKNVALKI